LITRLEHGQGPTRLIELRLSRPPVNALDPELMSGLRQALGQALADGAAGIVLSGAPGMFSAGLDVPALLRLDRAALGQTWQQFFGLLSDLAHCPVPLCAALTGHSPAGGTVLALFADYRVLAEGNFRIGLNEVQVGLPVPELLYRALIFLVGERNGARMATAGLLVDPAEALRVGLVDELQPVDSVIPRAIAWATELLQRPPHAMLATRALARRPLREAFATVDGKLIETVLDQWFSAETQAVMQALVARLGKPRPPG
jgi:3,2-trans-enoyl-CoA isomerase